jgi:long-chain acyl-CoA synthetase
MEVETPIEIPKGPRTEERTPLREGEPSTLVEMLEQAVKSYARPNLLNHKKDGVWHSISSEDVLERSRRIALGLYSLGVKRGDRVAILSDNCPEWTLSDAGSLFAGIVDVPIYPTLMPSQVAYILKDSGSRALFIANRTKLDQIRGGFSECDSLEKVVLFADDGPKASEAIGPGVMSLAELEERGRQLGIGKPGLLASLASQVMPDDLATIIYTSGTTGEPKGVMLTHSNLVSNMIDSSWQLRFGEGDTALSVLPLSHVYERLAMYMYIFHGMSVYYAESIDKIGENLREVRPTVFLGVPRLFEKIYGRIKDRSTRDGRLKAGLFNWAVDVAKDYAQYTSYNRPVPAWLRFKHKIAARLVFSRWRAGLGGRIRLFVSGGAALAEEIGYIFQGAGIPVLQGYGLSETSPVITASTPDDNRIGTVGRPIRHVQVRIAADGEIEARGPNIMRGYYNKPDATRTVFTEDGWFKTGDIGALDDDGFLRITDRKKELFKTSGGKYIAPQPIEQLIKGSRFVSQVVLVGNGRKFPSALIVPDWQQLRSYAEYKKIDARTPQELCSNPKIVDLFERQIASHTPDLAKYEKVKRIALLDHELTIERGELTPTLKVKRRVIDEKYKEVIDRMYDEAEASRNPD